MHESRLKDSSHNNPVNVLNLTIKYGSHEALSELCAAFHPGTMTAITGPNGSGKSTLIKAIMGLLPITKGRIEYAGFTSKDIAYLPQQNDLDRQFPLLVQDIVAMGLWRQIGAIRKITPSMVLSIGQALETVGLTGYERHPLYKLSGGQFQRVLFARMMLQDAPVILLDEPFAAVDEETIEDLMTLILQWHTQGKTILAVLHDKSLVEEYFPQTLLLKRGKAQWLSPNKSPIN